MLEAEFFEELPEDPIEAGRLICDNIIDLNESTGAETKRKRYYDFVRGYEVLKLLAEASSTPIPVATITAEDIHEDIRAIVEVCRLSLVIFAKQAVTSDDGALRGILTAKFGVGFVYEFTEGDLNRIQELLNELREYIVNADGLEDEHQQRLLKRLERLQGELHKKVSELDRFWGLVGDAGVVLGKLGKNAKPIVDRIKEIAEIVWRTQARKEELPSDSRPALLGDGEKEP